MVEFYETTYEMANKQNADLEAILFGQEDCAPSHGYGPTFRPYHLFHFVTKGQGFLEIDGLHEDQHTFSKVFKKERGLSPKDYRKNR